MKLENGRKLPSPAEPRVNGQSSSVIPGFGGKLSEMRLQTGGGGLLRTVSARPRILDTTWNTVERGLRTLSYDPAVCLLKHYTFTNLNSPFTLQILLHNASKSENKQI